VGRARTAGPTPVRSAQRLEALRKANAIRVSRAQLKKELATGAVRIEQILARPPDCANTERVSVLLLAVPKYGRVRASRLLARARISDSKTLSALSDRQRAELIAHFRSKADATHPDQEPASKPAKHGRVKAQQAEPTGTA
jgi:hypothetical protein